MIKDHLLLSNSRGNTILVRRDIIGEYVAPRIVRIVRDVTAGARHYASRSDGANVVAFAVVIPSNDLIGSLSAWSTLWWRVENKPQRIQAASQPLASTG